VLLQHNVIARFVLFSPKLLLLMLAEELGECHWWNRNNSSVKAQVRTHSWQILHDTLAIKINFRIINFLQEICKQMLNKNIYIYNLNRAEAKS